MANGIYEVTSVLEGKLAAARGVRIKKRAFTPNGTRAAREAFITSASNFVVPVIAIDGPAVGDGKPGALPKNLRRFYIETRRATAI